VDFRAGVVAALWCAKFHSAELPARGGGQVGERGGAVLAVPGRGAAVALAGAGGVAAERVPAQREGPAEQAERDRPLAGARRACAPGRPRAGPRPAEADRDRPRTKLTRAGARRDPWRVVGPGPPQSATPARGRVVCRIVPADTPGRGTRRPFRPPDRRNSLPSPRGPRPTPTSTRCRRSGSTPAALAARPSPARRRRRGLGATTPSATDRRPPRPRKLRRPFVCAGRSRLVKRGKSPTRPASAREGWRPNLLEPSAEAMRLSLCGLIPHKDERVLRVPPAGVPAAPGPGRQRRRHPYPAQDTPAAGSPPAELGRGLVTKPDVFSRNVPNPPHLAGLRLRGSPSARRNPIHLSRLKSFGPTASAVRDCARLREPPATQRDAELRPGRRGRERRRLSGDRCGRSDTPAGDSGGSAEPPPRLGTAAQSRGSAAAAQPAARQRPRSGVLLSGPGSPPRGGPPAPASRPTGGRRAPTDGREALPT
jgi:hypothetical protein